MLSGPAAFHMFTLLSVSQFRSSWPTALHVFDVSLLHHTWFKWMAPYQGVFLVEMLFSASNLPKCWFCELRKALLFSQDGGLNTLPHRSSIHRVLKEVLSFLTMSPLYGPYGTIQFCSCCCEQQHVTWLKVLKHCIHLMAHPGFLIGQCGDVFDAIDIIHTLLYEGTYFTYSSSCVLGYSLCFPEQSCSASRAPAGQTLTCFLVGFSLIRRDFRWDAALNAFLMCV